jgi:hypothetical protein
MIVDLGFCREIRRHDDREFVHLSRILEGARHSRGDGVILVFVWLRAVGRYADGIRWLRRAQFRQARLIKAD